MTVVLDDPSLEVRSALAKALASGLEAPRHIMLALATDLTEIAVMVLSRSPVFIDSELVDIAAGAETAPDRDRVAAAPVQRGRGGHRRGRRAGDLPAADRNPGAVIARISLRRMAERFGDDAEMREGCCSGPACRRTSGRCSSSA